LHIQYSYDNRSVVVVNSTNLDAGELTAEATLYDFNLSQRFSRKVRLASPADSVKSVCDIPDDNSGTDVYFVNLVLLDKAGNVVSRNFYWLPKKLSTYDWSLEQARQHPYYTAVTRYEDLSMLNRLDKVHLDASASVQREPGEEDVRVQIRNPSEHLAFMVHLSVVDEKTGEEILPVLWEDNYFSLLPGESRAVRAHYNSVTPHAHLRLEVNGWNIDAQAALVEETSSDPTLRPSS
jgi:exo-1,4-beta-D-glucosaminidase